MAALLKSFLLIRLVFAADPYIINCDVERDCNHLSINVSKHESADYFEINCNADYTCQYLNIFSSNTTLPKVSINCNASQSCLSAAFNVPSSNELSLNCIHSSSCIDTEIIANNATINLFDSCSTFQYIQCLDESSKCFIFCEDKSIQISSTNLFKVASINSVCVEQQFLSLCQNKIEKIQCTNNDNLNGSAIETVWNIQQITASNTSCPHPSNYNAHYEKRIVCNEENCALQCQDIDCSNNLIIDAQKQNVQSLEIQCGIRDRQPIYPYELIAIDCSNFDILCPHNCSLLCHHGNCTNINIQIADNDLFQMECSQHECSNITVYADYAEKIQISCFKAICSHFVIYANYAQNVMTSAITQSIIYAQNAKNIELDSNNIYFSSDHSWSYTSTYYWRQFGIVLFANYSKKISLKCYEYSYDGFGCESIEIFAGYANNLDIATIGQFASKNISIFAEYAKDISIVSDQLNAFYDSSVYASHATNLRVSCFGGYDESSCALSKIYFSAMSTKFNCEGFGCSNIEIFVDPNDEISFLMNGCDQCHSVNECAQNWKIEDSTNTFLERVNDAFIDNMTLCHFPTNAPTQSPTIFHIDPSYDMLSDNAMRNFSNLLSFLCIFVIFVIVSIVIYEIIKFQMRKYQKKHVSKRPPSVLLFGTFLSDFLIFVGMNWWIIKSIKYYSSVNEYCFVNYPITMNGTPISSYLDHDASETAEICRSDDLCYTFDGYGYYYECGASIYSDDDCNCVIDSGAKSFFITWWVFCGLLVLLEAWRIIEFLQYDYLNFGNVDATYANFHWLQNRCIALRCNGNRGGSCGSNCICFKFVLWKTSWRQAFIQNVFWKRTLWIGPRSYSNPKRHRFECCYFVDMFCRYFIHLIFASVFYAYFCSDVSVHSDVALNGSDFWPILILLLIRFGLQWFYFVGDEYDLREDWPWQINEELVDKFGHGIGLLVQSYLPIFYDPKLCKSEFLMKEKAENDFVSLESDSESNGDGKSIEMNDMKCEDEDEDDEKLYYGNDDHDEKISSVVSRKKSDKGDLRNPLL